MSQFTHHHRARKRFGQNFLVDEGVIDRIVRGIAPRVGDKLVEIGPGHGALTGELLDSGAHLTAIELDRDLVPRLQAHLGHNPRFAVEQADALRFDFSTLAATPLRIVGNLPYNISTPLIFHLLGFRRHIRDMHFMLQKEVVERMAADPGQKSYGRLGIMTQYYCRVEHLFNVDPQCFRPAPRVESAIVRLTPYNTLPVEANDPVFLEKLVKTAFQQRRKTLRNTLKQLVPSATIDALELDTQRRPETLSLAEFVALSNRLATPETP